MKESSVTRNVSFYSTLIFSLLSTALSKSLLSTTLIWCIYEIINNFRFFWNLILTRRTKFLHATQLQINVTAFVILFISILVIHIYVCIYIRKRIILPNRHRKMCATDYNSSLLTIQMNRTILINKKQRRDFIWIKLFDLFILTILFILRPLLVCYQKKFSLWM